MLVVGWRELQSCPRRGRRDKSRLILFIWGEFVCAGTFGIFHPHALTACLVGSPISPLVFVALLKVVKWLFMSGSTESVMAGKRFCQKIFCV